MKNTQTSIAHKWGFTTLEYLIIVAIVTILVAVAASYYNHSNLLADLAYDGADGKLIAMVDEGRTSHTPPGTDDPSMGANIGHIESIPLGNPEDVTAGGLSLNDESRFGNSPHATTDLTVGNMCGQMEDVSDIVKKYDAVPGDLAMNCDICNAENRDSLCPHATADPTIGNMSGHSCNGLGLPTDDALEGAVSNSDERHDIAPGSNVNVGGTSGHMERNSIAPTNDSLTGCEAFT